MSRKVKGHIEIFASLTSSNQEVMFETHESNLEEAMMNSLIQLILNWIMKHCMM